MKQAIFLVLNHYADWESAYLSSQLNQSPKWQVKIASTEKEVTAIGGFRTKVDYQLNQIPRDCELLILIGGNSWSFKNDILNQLVKRRLEHEQKTAAICGAVDYLAENGLLTGFKHTGNSQSLWRDFKQYQNHSDFFERQVVTDRNLVTANGTAALEFTQQVLKMVHFKENEEIEKDIDLYQIGFYQYCEKYGNPFS